MAVDRQGLVIDHLNAQLHKLEVSGGRAENLQSRRCVSGSRSRPVFQAIATLATVVAGLSPRSIGSASERSKPEGS